MQNLESFTYYSTKDIEKQRGLPHYQLRGNVGYRGIRATDTVARTPWYFGSVFEEAGGSGKFVEPQRRIKINLIFAITNPIVKPTYVFKIIGELSKPVDPKIMKEWQAAVDYLVTDKVDPARIERKVLRVVRKDGGRETKKIQDAGSLKSFSAGIAPPPPNVVASYIKKSMVDGVTPAIIPEELQRLPLGQLPRDKAATMDIHALRRAAEAAAEEWNGFLSALLRYTATFLYFLIQTSSNKTTLFSEVNSRLELMYKGAQNLLSRRQTSPLRDIFQNIGKWFKTGEVAELQWSAGGNQLGNERISVHFNSSLLGAGHP
ncbi:hypothetical protein BJ742DRAFT_871749 [Cladochytrium replicatum]|nr:hypothetical protein BJ742DRAFT_871749 [Cladochytrium replicatum]